MSLATVKTRAVSGISAPAVKVEVHLSRGLPAFNIVGLPEAAVRESRDRVRSAIINSGFEFPRSRITVNLAPADLPKEGGRYDLPIAVGILAASGLVPAELLDSVFIGELALSGALRETRGVLVTLLACANEKERLIVPVANDAEAGLLPDASILMADSLLDVAAFLKGQADLTAPAEHSDKDTFQAKSSLADVRGQPFAKRALLIAAAGQHNLLFYGSPGTGKTMLATRLPCLLPELSVEEALEVAAIHSISAAGLDAQKWRERPFRAPHHSASGAAIVGGGSRALPGEVSLAHRGILFLDELTEFDSRVLETLREPLESGIVTISRAAVTQSYKAKCLLVAAMNSCKCGYFGETDPALRTKCRCTPDQITRYRAKISGPLLDRIDMHVHVPRVPHEALAAPPDPNEPSMSTLQAKVADARALQMARQGCLNGDLGPKQLDEVCKLDSNSHAFVQTVIDRLGLSARAYHRILKVARTITDLKGKPAIMQADIAQAIQLRSFDRNN